MATSAGANEVYQCRLEGMLEGQQVINVLHFQTPAGTADVETTLLLVVLSCFITNILPILASPYTFTRMISKRVAPTVGPDIVTLDANNTAAGGPGTQLPSYAAAVVSIHTVRAGRSGRGRIFFGAIPEVNTNGSALDSGGAYWQGLIAFCACIVQNFHATDVPQPDQWWFGVVSRKLGTAKPPFNVSQFASISKETTPGALVPVAQLGTQRSRKVGHGS